jgi:hypothetical protein
MRPYTTKERAKITAGAAAERVFQTLEGSSARSAAIAETSQNAIFLAEEVVIVPRAKGHQGQSMGPLSAT